MKNFSYFFKEGISNLFTNKMVTFTTIITVIVSLLITGIFQIISINVVTISKELGDNFEFNIFVKDSISNEQLEDVKLQIQSVDMVKEIVLKSKSETFNEVKEKIGDDSILKGLSQEDNPFRDCFKVTVTDLSSAESIITEIQKIDAVDSVSNNIEASKQINTMAKKVKIYSGIAYILLAFLCLSIVSNIINVSIFSRRKHINIMKYVGATNSFVKIPFIIEGVIIGIIGAIVSSGILIYCYHYLFDSFNQVVNGFYLLKPFDVLKTLFIANTIYGVTIGALGAGFAVNKHLKV